MKATELLDMIGETEDSIIEEAKKRKKTIASKWTKWVAVAACLCLVIVGAISIFPNKNTENGTTNNVAGEGSYVTEVPMIEIRVKVDIINAWGFIGTIETGAATDACTFLEGEQISVVCEDNVSIIQKDGSIFAFNEVDPNVDESDLEVGEYVWIGFQSYDYAEGNGMYNQVFVNHVSRDRQ